LRQRSRSGVSSRERRRFARKLFDNTDIVRIPFSMDIAETKLTRAFWKTPFIPDTSASAATRFDQVLAIQSHGLASASSTPMRKNCSSASPVA
jgi:hypothetical protein